MGRGSKDSLPCWESKNCMIFQYKKMHFAPKTSLITKMYLPLHTGLYKIANNRIFAVKTIVMIFLYGIIIVIFIRDFKHSVRYTWVA